MCVTIKCFNIIALYTSSKQNNETTTKNNLKNLKAITIQDTK